MIIHLSRLGVASVGEILEYDDELFEPEVNALFPKDRVTGLKKEKTWWHVSNFNIRNIFGPTFDSIHIKVPVRLVNCNKENVYLVHTCKAMKSLNRKL